MKSIVFLTCLAVLFIGSCKSEGPESIVYDVRDYRTVKLYLDTLNLKMRRQFDSTGTYTIPYTDLTNGNKQLIFFGTSHTRDVSHPQFSQLANSFIKMKPEIAFNEGGQIPTSTVYPSRESAISANGEIGLLKYLCDSIGIKMINGDMDDQQEIAALQKKISKDDLYLYLAVERYLNGYKQNHYPGVTLEEGWRTKLIPYLLKSGFKLTSEEQSLDYLKKIYKRQLAQNFSIDSLIELHEYYLISDSKMGDVGRSTKIVRDQALLEKLDHALDTNDKVFVVFGGSHRLAVAPALQQIINKKRN